MRPKVLIAAPSDKVARLLELNLAPICESLGLSLQAGPVSDRLSFRHSEELVEFLAQQDPLLLLDTCLVLHVGPDVEECFCSGISCGKSPWHKSSTLKPGLALEVSLRFPQLSAAYLIPGFNENAGTDDDYFHDWKQGLETDAQNSFGSSLNLNRNWERLHFASSTDPSLTDLHLILGRFANGFRTLYDPSGLRTLLRNRFLAQIFGSRTASSGGWESTSAQRAILLARLRNYLVAIDEEPDITLLTGYAAYKFGYRVWMVNTFSGFNQAGSPAWWDISDKRVIRDVDLRFPDIPQDDEHGFYRDKLADINSSLWADKLVQFSNNNLVRSSVVRVLTQSENVTAVSPKEFSATADHGQYDKPQRNPPGSPDRWFVGIRKPLPSLYKILELLSPANVDQVSIVSRLVRVRVSGHTASHGAPYTNLRIASDLVSNAARCRLHGDVGHVMLSALLSPRSPILAIGNEPQCRP